MSQRKIKVAQRIKEEVSSILHDEIKDPRIGFTTITRVEITNDLRSARIFYSVLGSEEQKKHAREGLNSCLKFCRKLLGERLKIRYTPDLAFKYDDTLDYDFRINEIFSKIEDERKEKEGKQE